jgi:hypothetical protein
VKATDVITAMIPRRLRAEASKLDPATRERLAAHLMSNLRSVADTLGPAAICEVAVDLAAATIHRAFGDYTAGLRSVEFQPGAYTDPDAERASLRQRYEQTEAAAIAMRDAVVGQYRAACFERIGADRREILGANETRVARLTRDIEAAAQLGTGPLEQYIASIPGEMVTDLRTAIATTTMARRAAADPDGGEVTLALNRAAVALTPPEVRGAIELLSQLDSIEPAFAPGPGE